MPKSTLKLKLVLLVYRCPYCEQDTTYEVEAVESKHGWIPRLLDVECPYPDCPNKSVGDE